MDKKTRAKYEKLLVQKKKELEKAYLEKIQKSGEAGADGTLDSVDEASVNYNKEYWYSLSDSDRKILRLINDALQRTKEQSFGECLHCGEKIEEKRLEAVPWARYCVHCQDLHDKGLLQEEEE
ncbi:MAG: TraR/DksA family transcriptional regulator [Acidobacteriota bacterium]